MAHWRKTEDCLDALNRLREGLPAPAAFAELARYLAHKSNQVVAKAAGLVADLKRHDLGPALVEAFHRFMRDPATTDRGCAAKTGIIRALEAVGRPKRRFFSPASATCKWKARSGRPLIPRLASVPPAPWDWST